MPGLPQASVQTPPEALERLGEEGYKVVRPSATRAAYDLLTVNRGEVCYRCAIIHESSKDFFVDIIWIHDFVSKALPRVSDGADDEDEDGER